jgi:hypothetical protein
MPRDVTTVLGKRGSEQLDKFARLAEAYFKTLGKPVESSDPHASSGSAPLGPDHGSTNVVQAPAPNPALSITNPSPLMEPSSPLSAASSKPTMSDSEDLKWLPQPNPKKRPWRDLDPDPDFNWNRMNFVNRPPPRPASGLADGWTDLKQPVPSIPKEPSLVSSPNHAPPSPGDRLNKLLFSLATLRAIFSKNRSRQPHVRRQAHHRQGPLIGGRTSSNRYRDIAG